MWPSLTQLPKATELRRFERPFARRPLVIESGAPREPQNVAPNVLVTGTSTNLDHPS
jgi:hypothetical protein